MANSSAYAACIRERMNAGGRGGFPVTIRLLSTALGRSYEHLRKVVIGEPVVSKALNEEICEYLGLDVEEMWRLAAREKASRRFGEEIVEAVQPPNDKRFADVWEKLSEADRRQLLSIAETMALAAEARSQRLRATSGGRRKRR